MIEDWRAIPGFEGLYEVSNEGRVRSIRGGTGTRVGLILKPQLLNPKKHYLAVWLRKDGRAHALMVHRLVCYAFHGPPTLDKNVVLHRDDDRLNNRPENLQWGTQAENNHDMKLKGRAPGGRGWPKGKPRKVATSVDA